MRYGDHSDDKKKRGGIAFVVVCVLDHFFARPFAGPGMPIQTHVVLTLTSVMPYEVPRGWKRCALNGVR